MGAAAVPTVPLAPGTSRHRFPGNAKASVTTEHPPLCRARLSAACGLPSSENHVFVTGREQASGILVAGPLLFS